MEDLAYSTKFVQRRHSKVTGFTFLIAVLTGLASAAPSLESICSHLGIRISRQAIDQRFNRYSVAFLKACLELLFQKISSSITTTPVAGLFSRVLVCDSTQWKLKKKLAKAYRGFGGSASKASCKLQTIIEPLSGKIVHWYYSRACFPDQGYAKNLPGLLNPLDVLLMDLGYYSVKVFKTIERKKAFFISRIHYNAAIRTLSVPSLKTNVAGLLKTFSDPLNDMQLIVGSEQTMELRLIAVKLPSEKAAAQRRRVKENYRKQGRQASKEKLQCCDWNVLITNLKPSLLLSAEQILQLYATRWQIEIFFRDAKSLLRINVCRSSKKSRFEAELLGTLFLASLLFFLYGCFNNRAKKKETESSLDKIIKRFKDLASSFFSLLRLQTQHALQSAVKLLLRLLRNSIKFHQPTRKTPRELLKSCGVA
ncbi:MAG: IS4 family transposase [Acidobacteriota bacterium]